MSISVKYALVIVALWVGCGAKSLSTDGPRQFDIKDVVNRTICPFEITVNYNHDRIPKRITEVKCLVKPAAQHQDDQHCRKMTADGKHGHCVQLRDLVRVLVRHENGRQEFKTEKVAVGCNCMLTEHRISSRYPDPD